MPPRTIRGGSRAPATISAIDVCSRREIPYFPDGAAIDVVHTSTSLKANDATSQQKHFAYVTRLAKPNGVSCV
jgi:hypothetical protein